MLSEDARLEATQPENNNSDANMASLLEQEGAGSISLPKAGETRTGVIASISATQILVSVGSKSEGVISGREFEAIPADVLAELQVGQEIPVYVISEDSSGMISLSFMRARDETDWIQADELLKSKQAYRSKIIGYNKGGLIVPLGNIRGFIPASQFSLSRRAALAGDVADQKFSKMVGEDVDVCVLEINREKNRLILSERAASTETREMVREKLLEDLKEGDIRTGRVTSVAEFGVFVNIGGADGLVHVSEVSWSKLAHPGEILKVGDEVKVKVITIDQEKKRIGLSLRQLQADPWDDKVAKYKVGQLVEATITRLTKFGAFAKLEEDMEGLIHISEMSDRRIEHPKEVLREGETLTLRVIKIDLDNHRIGLSVRKVESMQYADMDWQLLEDSLTGESAAEDTKKDGAPQSVEEAHAEEKPEAVEAEGNLAEAAQPAEESPAAEAAPAATEPEPTEESSTADEPQPDQPGEEDKTE